MYAVSAGEIAALQQQLRIVQAPSVSLPSVVGVIAHSGSDG
jgi:hypothetical protein